MIVACPLPPLPAGSAHLVGCGHGLPWHLPGWAAQLHGRKRACTPEYGGERDSETMEERDSENMEERDSETMEERETVKPWRRETVKTWRRERQ